MRFLERFCRFKMCLTSLSRKTICFDECKFYCWVGRVREINKVVDFGFRKSPHWEYVISKSLPEKWLACSSCFSTWGMKMTEKETAILVPIAMQCGGSVRSVCLWIWISFLLRSAALSLPNLKQGYVHLTGNGLRNGEGGMLVQREYTFNVA